MNNLTMAAGVVVFAFLQSAAANETDELTAYLEQRIIRIETADDLDPLMERIGSARLVLLGESSHGTSEYYRWRAKISRRLIEEKGFDFIAVEGDWPSCYEVNRYIKGLAGAAPTAKHALASFQRWPQWMWANQEVEELVEWLAGYNARGGPKAGFYGMDLYAVAESIEAVLDYKQRHAGELADEARRHYQCLARFNGNLHDYARYFAQTGQNCGGQTEAVVELLRRHSQKLREQDAKAYFNAKQNALLVQNAERHYRGMADPRMNSWNERVGHFQLTLRRLMEHHGPQAKGIVWAHNTHVGDARATSMTREGMQNIGQLTRQEFGAAEVVLVGFGTHRGTVQAGRSWGSPMETMTVPAAVPRSVEDVFNRLGVGKFLLIFNEKDLNSPLSRYIGHRAKGVVYNPAAEVHNYVPTIMPRRYDAFIFIDETSALTPIDTP